MLNNILNENSGVFDINSTLIIIMFEFLLLIIILDILLYYPFSTLYRRRIFFKNYNIKKAANLSLKAKKNEKIYKEEYSSLKKKYKIEANEIRIYLKEIFDIELTIFQYYNNYLLKILVKDLYYEKKVLYKNVRSILLKVYKNIKKKFNF